MHKPPGSASASSRDAMLTPSPKMSAPSAITSARLMPMRNRMRQSSGRSTSRSTMPRCTSTAQRTASNDAGKLDEQPITGCLHDPATALFDLGIYKLLSMRLEAIERTFFIYAHQARITRHIRYKNGSESTGGSHARSRRLLAV